MTDTIEVPISLIKAGDMDAIRELLPKENLFGRWATHLRLGRGIIYSIDVTESGHVAFAHPRKMNMDGSEVLWVGIGDLIIDPVELVTAEDFKDAPNETVVAKPQGNAYQKVYADYWESYDDELKTEELSASGPWTILRWGWGEQQ